jgi:ankyrin repeat protein
MVVLLLCSLFVASPRLQSPSLNSQLIAAAQKEEASTVAALLAKGASVNAQNEFELTPLIIAADKGNIELVRLLVARGADVSVKDHTYGKTALRAAITSWNDLRGSLAPKASRERADIIGLLLSKGADGGEALAEMIANGYVEAARAVMERGGLDRTYLNQALSAARRTGQSDLIEVLTKAGAGDPAPEENPRSVERFKLLAGSYRSESGSELTLALLDEDLMLDRAGRDRVFLLPLDLTTLRSRDRRVVVSLTVPKVPPAQLTLTDGGSSELFTRIPDK